MKVTVKVPIYYTSILLFILLWNVTQSAWLSQQLSKRYENAMHPIRWFFQTRQPLWNKDKDKGGGGGNLIDRSHGSVPMTTPELIEAAGYPVEIHHVLTEDGYILELHRIPHGKNKTKSGHHSTDKNKNDDSTSNSTSSSSSSSNSTKSEEKSRKSPILVMHGWTCSSINWLLNSANQAMPFLLADQGYDVWMGNFRGNAYSRLHTKFANNQKEFWNFTFHEIGMFDVPAMMDYILEETEESKLIYVGHSMGTTAFFVTMSQRPEYNDKINSMFALAPVAYFTHLRRKTRLLTPFLRTERLPINFANHGELVPSAMLEAIKLFGGLFCSPESRTSGVCDGFLQHVSSATDSEDLSVPMFFRHYPDSTSMKTFVHFTQEVKSGKFCQFDYGSFSNFRIYGKVKPPAYNLTNIVAPVAIYYAKSDWLAAPEDTNLLTRQLPNLIDNYRVKSETFTHLDFLSYTSAAELLYKRIIQKINEQSL